jgi:hypothetical protein
LGVLVIVPTTFKSIGIALFAVSLSLAASAQEQVTAQFRHGLATNIRGATASRRELDFSSVIARSSAQSALGGNSFSSPLRYPGDLAYNGGPVVRRLVSHPIYLDPSGKCTAACWGDPEAFLRDLGRSAFIHVIDQFVGANDPNRYTVAQGVKSKTPSQNLLTDADIVNLVHAVAKKTGQTGYGHEYHVFLTAGTDECFDDTFSVCYSPDSPSTWFFCAYHGSVDFPDIGHVLYSVEPFQNVPGCAVTGEQPNGALAGSTNNVLSHELFETITDPDGTAWFNTADNGLFGEEIGDECSFVNATGFDPSLFIGGGRLYAAQPEYSNDAHACASSP